MSTATLKGSFFELAFSIVNEDAGDLVSRTIKQFINEYKENGSKAFWFRLMNEADDYSVRQWMTK